MANGKQGAILNSTIVAICGEGFQASLPAIQKQTWFEIVSLKQTGAISDRNQRLEFLGDAMVYLALALELYERFPDATPGFMTVRLPLVCPSCIRR